MKKACAIYTRKSTDERLDMEFNTLDAQREACEAYITSQKSEGWIASKEIYNDGGFSGGSLNRPALNKLLDDIKAGKIQIVVVYKIDRLTRSLMDFAKLVQVFDEHGVTFVSVTQSFNTTTSMGRLTLNVLLSFAQFEREISGERIRDKIAASKARGMWMGGKPPIGYKIENRQLVINPDEVALARQIFERYIALGNVRFLKTELDQKGMTSPARKSKKGITYGKASFSRGALYATLKNPAYIGKISHKGKIYDGLHEGIIPLELWEKVQARLKDQTTEREDRTKRRYVLQGLIYTAEEKQYVPTYTSRHNRQYCYYVLSHTKPDAKYLKNGMNRLPAHDLETTVETALRDQIMSFIADEDSAAIKHILQHQMTIPSYDLMRTCIDRVTVRQGLLKITVTTTEFHKLVQMHLGLKIEALDKTCEISVPFMCSKERYGTLIMKPEKASKDIFDLPAPKLKKLVQGVIWRDEHFHGLSLKQISKREKCSEAYVSTAIFESFKLLQSA